MAVPKSKVSKQRRNKRRSSVWKLETPGVNTCPKCGAVRLPHRVCKSCMTYNGHELTASKCPACEQERELSQGLALRQLLFCPEKCF